MRELAVRCLKGEFRTFDPASVRVLLLDGGKGQLSAVTPLFEEFNVGEDLPDIPLRSLAKRVRILAIQRKTSRRGRFQCAKHVQQRALSTSRRSHDRYRIATLERQ